jgi:hypothetical protein
MKMNEFFLKKEKYDLFFSFALQYNTLHKQTKELIVFK